MGSRVERTHGKVVAGGLGWARLQLVDQVTHRATQGSSVGK